MKTILVPLLLAAILAPWGPARPAFAAAPAPEGADPAALESLIDGYIRSFPPHQDFSGVVLVADGDRILFHRGYGLANREFGLPNGPQTRFQIGSLTKTFTAMLVLRCVERGLLDLDGTIADYLPGYPEPNGSRITIRQLLTHTSGMPHHYLAIPDYFSREDHFFHTPRELIGLFSEVPLRHEPGERFTYSSPGYYLLGAILQQVSRQSYAELLAADICGPLGMHDTFVENNRTTDRNLATGYVRSVAGLVEAYREDKSTALAAGDILATAYDLYLWQRTLAAEGDDILSAGSKAVLFQPALPGAPMTMTGQHFEIPYAEGKSLAVSLLSGSSSGYAAYLGRQTDSDRCVIVLSNINGDDVARIADDIGDIFNRQFLGIAIGEEAPLTRTLPPAATLPAAELERILGFYRSPDGNFAGVVRDGEGLFYLEFNPRAGLQWVLALTPLGEGAFQLGHVPAFACTFTGDGPGGAARLTASRHDRAFNEADRLVEPVAVDAATYAGWYTSLDLQRTFHLAAVPEGLVAADFLGESAVRFVPLDKDLFGYSRGFLRFLRDRDGALDGFEVFSKDTDGYFGSRFIRIVC